MGKKFSIDHFISEGEKRITIYDIINRFESGKNAKQEETYCHPVGFQSHSSCQVGTQLISLSTETAV